MYIYGGTKNLSLVYFVCMRCGSICSHLQFLASFAQLSFAMVKTLQQREEGTLLEFALRREVRGQPPSAWARTKKLGDVMSPFRTRGGGFFWERFPLAAAVVNPVARELFSRLASEHGVHIKFVQAAICKVDTSEKLSIDVVAVCGTDRWWLELRWTRDPLNTDSLSVQGAWSVVDKYQQVLRQLKAWKLDVKLGGGRVFRPRRLGVLLVNSQTYRLELRGKGGAVLTGRLDGLLGGGGGGSLSSGGGGGGGFLLGSVGRHRPLAKRKRSGPRPWAKTAKAKEGQVRWRQTEDGWNAVAASVAERRNFRDRKDFGTRRSRPTLAPSLHFGCVTCY